MFRIIFLVVALAAGGVAAWLTFSMQGAPAVATTALAVSTQDVLVASADILRGQALAKENVHWQAWPVNAVNASYIRRSVRPDAVETLSGAIVRGRMSSGEPVREEMLIPANSGFLSSTLPSGRRAVAVRISAESTAGGFILPNDRVDVISTAVRDGPTVGEKRHVSVTILKNVPVLAIDQNVDDKKKDEKAKDDKNAPKQVFVGKTATLEVDSKQAEILAAGEAAGPLSLVLRSAADNGDAPLDNPQSSPASTRVQIFRGGQTDAPKTQ